MPGFWGQSTQTPELKEQFVVRHGEEVQVGKTGLRIRFTDLVNDSRCPIDAVCVHQGNARITLEFARNKKKPAAMDVNTSMEPREAAYKNFAIELVSLLPAPRASQPTPESDYQATLIVRKIKNR